MFSRRIQIQDRLTDQIVKCLHEYPSIYGVAVIMEAQHLFYDDAGQ